MSIIKRVLACASAALLLPVTACASITLTSDFRLIRADAVIDFDGDGAAEIWEVDAESAPTQFAPWDADVSAVASLTVDIDDESKVVYAMVWANASHESSFDVAPTRLEYIATIGLSLSMKLLVGSEPEGDSEGYPRQSGAFASTMFEITLDDFYSYEVTSGAKGPSDTNWDLVDIQANAIVASAANMSGIIGPGSYRFQQVISHTDRRKTPALTTSIVVEAVGSAAPEPGPLVVWCLLAASMVAMAPRAPR